MAHDGSTTSRVTLNMLPKSPALVSSSVKWVYEPLTELGQVENWGGARHE